jgi:error-prone DNA polymerase
VGALNWVEAGADSERLSQARHRRDALWEIECAARPAGPLFECLNPSLSVTSNPAMETGCRHDPCPLEAMTVEERLVADFRGTAMTVGRHPMAHCRAEMKTLGVLPAIDLARVPDGRSVRIAGGVIARQRPGTAKGFVFLSLEDETGIANAIVTPDLFEQNRSTLVHEQFLLIEGKLQNQDNVISVKADRVSPLTMAKAQTSSHDFH